ncbi:hypothetical protein [Clostridium sp. ZBS18]|uniref:competence protein CoiA family protein n=1 Tax=Clostridium sp. ZBS18 TaxID=2949967 RepID=UPI00207B0234|nr:hypothetical protein [Clostridium sp. ZBS18]
MSEVNIWFANNKEKKIIKIWDIPKDKKHDEYRCPICNGLLRPKQGEIMIWHFSHINAEDCSTEACVHWWLKNELLKRGESFKVKIDGEIKEYICKETLIEHECNTTYGTYKPDLTIITEDGEEVYFEIANTNKKKPKDYLSIWQKLNKIVVEVDKKDMTEGNKIEIFNAIYWDGKIFRDQVKDLKKFVDIKFEKNKYNKKEIEKLYWLIDDICKYNNGELEIDAISDEIQAVEDEKTRKLIVELLRHKCSNVMNDYIEYNNTKIEKELNNNIHNNNLIKYEIQKFIKMPNKFDKVSIKLYLKNYILIEDKIMFNNYREDIINIINKGKIKEILYLYDKFKNENIIHSNNIIKVNFLDGRFSEFYIGENLTKYTIDNYCSDLGEKLFNENLNTCIKNLNNVLSCEKFNGGVNIKYTTGSEFYIFNGERKINIIEKIKFENNIIDDKINELNSIKLYLENNLQDYLIKNVPNSLEVIKIINVQNDKEIILPIHKYSKEYVVNNIGEIYYEDKLNSIKNGINTYKFDLKHFNNNKYGDLCISIGIHSFNSWEYNKVKQRNRNHRINYSLFYTWRYISEILINKGDIIKYNEETLINKINEFISARNQMYNENIRFNSNEVKLEFGKNFISKNKLNNIHEIKNYSFVLNDNIVNLYNRKLYFNGYLYIIPISFNNINDINERKSYIKKLIKDSESKNGIRHKTNSNKLRNLLKTVFKYYNDTYNISNIDFDYIKRNGYYDINLTKNDFETTLKVKYYKNKFLIINTKTFINSEKELISYIGNIIRSTIYK